MQQKNIFSAKEQENLGSIQVFFSLLGQVRTELVGLVKNIKLHFSGFATNVNRLGFRQRRIESQHVVKLFLIITESNLGTQTIFFVP